LLDGGQLRRGVRDGDHFALQKQNRRLMDVYRIGVARAGPRGARVKAASLQNRLMYRGAGGAGSVSERGAGLTGSHWQRACTPQGCSGRPCLMAGNRPRPSTAATRACAAAPPSRTAAVRAPCAGRGRGGGGVRRGVGSKVVCEVGAGGAERVGVVARERLERGHVVRQQPRMVAAPPPYESELCWCWCVRGRRQAACRAT